VNRRCAGFVFLASRRMSLRSLQDNFGGCVVIDVTSRATEPWIRFSPFFPHEAIPVPFSPPTLAVSVEGIWQGLKVFETADIDVSKFSNRSMKNLKRSVRRFGRVLGHRKGVYGKELLNYSDARKLIYIPSYEYIMKNFLQNLLSELNEISRQSGLVLLDYQKNFDPDDLSVPLSHAALIRKALLK